MKKNFLKIIVYFLILSAAVFFLYHNLNEYLQFRNPFGWHIDIKNVYAAYSDKDDNIYRIDDSKQRITKINSRGELVFSINIEKDFRTIFQGCTSVFSELTAGDDGYLYVKKTLIDPGGYYVLEESILKYDSRGKKAGTIFFKEYSAADKNPRPGHIRSVEYKKGFLYFFDVDESKVIFNKVPLNAPGEETENVTFPLRPDLYLNRLAGEYPDKVFFTTKKGEIFAVEPSGNHRKIFPLSDDQSSSSPVYLGLDSKGKIYFADESGRRICRIDPNSPGVVEDLLSEQLFQQSFGKDNLMIIKHMTVRADGAIASIINDTAYFLDAKGAVSPAKYQDKYSVGKYLLNCALWIWPCLIILALLQGLILLYRSFLRKRVETKQISIFILIMAFTMSIASVITFFQCKGLFTDQIEEKLTAQIQIATKQLDLSIFNEIKKPADFMGNDYQNIRSYIHVIQGHLNPRGNKILDAEKMNGYYSTIYKIEQIGDNKIYSICVTDDNYESLFYPYLPSGTDKKLYDSLTEDENADTNTCFFPNSQDADGSWTFILKPIFDSDNKAVGLYEMGMNSSIISSYEKKIFLYISLANFFIALISIILIWVFTRLLLKPLHLLKESVEQVAGGNLGALLSIKSGDEMESLGNSFNNMSEKLREQFMEIKHTNTAYEHFVPREFKEFLRDKEHPGGKAITDIRLGDQCDYEMCIMFSSIRSFYRLSKDMSSTESFRFINGFLKAIGPVIPQNSGFVNKYLGSGIMALFPVRPYDAVNAAIKMRRNLKEYNKQYSKENNKEIDISIAIHYCPLILGIIGEESRMEGTVISEGVILAEALEKVTGKLGASILVTESIIALLENREKFKYRYLGLLSLESNKAPVAVYDLFHSDPENIRKAKEDSKAIFEEGVGLYKEKRFEEARSRFIDVIKINNQDEAAKIYFFLCDEHLQKGLPEAWDGSVHV